MFLFSLQASRFGCLGKQHRHCGFLLFFFLLLLSSSSFLALNLSLRYSNVMFSLCIKARLCARCHHNSTQQHFGRYSARKLHIICATGRGDFTHSTHAHTASNSYCRKKKFSDHSVEICRSAVWGRTLPFSLQYMITVHIMFVRKNACLHAWIHSIS